MRDAGIAELGVDAAVAVPAGGDQAAHFDDGGVVEPHLIQRFVQPPGEDEPRRRADADISRIAHKAVLDAVAGDAARAVAAHLPERAVGIVKEHGDVRVFPSGGKDDQTVRAWTGSGRTQTQGEVVKILALEFAAQGLREEEGVPRAVHFGKAHLIVSGCRL